MHLVQGEIGGASDVHQDPARAVHRVVGQQWRRDRHACGLGGAVRTAGEAGPHHRRSPVAHHGAHVGEVDVDVALDVDEVGDAPHRLQEHVVGELEGSAHRGLVVHEVHEPLVRDGDQGVGVAAELVETALGDAHAAPAFEVERQGHDPHGEGARVSGHLGHHRGRAGARPSPESGGHEDQVGAGEQLGERLPVLERGLAAHFGVGTRPQPAGEGASELEATGGVRLAEGLSVGVHRHEVDPGDAGRDHRVDRVAAATANPDDHDAGPASGDLVATFDHAHPGPGQVSTATCRPCRWRLAGMVGTPRWVLAPPW